jgi:quinol monooxygenase YgiN
MIIRVLQAKVFPGRQAEFKRIIELLSLPQIRAKTGMVGVFPGQTAGPNSNEFVLVTVWKSLSALKKHSLEDWVKAILPEEALPLLQEWRLQRYDAFGIAEKTETPMFMSMRYQSES